MTAMNPSRFCNGFSKTPATYINVKHIDQLTSEAKFLSDKP